MPIQVHTHSPIHSPPTSPTASGSPFANEPLPDSRLSPQQENIAPTTLTKPSSPAGSKYVPGLVTTNVPVAAQVPSSSAARYTPKPLGAPPVSPVRAGVRPRAATEGASTGVGYGPNTGGVADAANSLAVPVPTRTGSETTTLAPRLDRLVGELNAGPAQERPSSITAPSSPMRSSRFGVNKAYLPAASSRTDVPPLEEQEAKPLDHPPGYRQNPDLNMEIIPLPPPPSTPTSLRSEAVLGGLSPTGGMGAVMGGYGSGDAGDGGEEFSVVGAEVWGVVKKVGRGVLEAVEGVEGRVWGRSEV